MIPPPAVAIIGPGAVGTALAILLQGVGHPIRVLIGRQLESARRAAGRLNPVAEVSTDLAAAAGADWILLTTPDRAIQATCREAAAAGVFANRPLVAHCSGALDAAEPLAAARQAGCLIASCHPLLSFADVEQATAHFQGTFCFLEGDPAAIDLLSPSLDQLGARTIPLRPGSKTLYHAAAAVASNNLVAGTALAVELLGRAGLAENEALQALLPLLGSTLDNLAAVGLPDALTGPIARGDDEVVAAHLKALRQHAPERLVAYRTLARLALGVAIRKGSLDEESIESLRRLLDDPGEPSCS